MNKLKTINSNGEALIDIELTFAPKEVLDAQVQLIVHKSTGGRWCFDLDLCASSLAPNGTIIIESSLNETTYSPIQLCSTTLYPEPFTTELSSNSSSEFVVNPTQVRLLLFVVKLNI